MVLVVAGLAAVISMSAVVVAVVAVIVTVLAVVVTTVTAVEVENTFVLDGTKFKPHNVCLKHTYNMRSKADIRSLRDTECFYNTIYNNIMSSYISNTPGQGPQEEFYFMASPVKNPLKAPYSGNVPARNHNCTNV